MKILATTLILLLTPNCVTSKASKVENVSKVNKDMQDELNRKSQKNKGKPKTKNSITMKKSIHDLNLSGILKKVPKKGQKIAPFSLKNHKGEIIKSQTLLKSNQLVITFYRGGWCPYCNIQLHAFQKILPEIEKLNGRLIAISPEKPDETLNTSQKNKLEFTVLSDVNNKYARKLGLVYTLPKDLRKVYLKYGINLVKNQGNNKWELPLSATFVVAQDGTIKYVFANADYKKRADLRDVVAALKTPKSKPKP